MSSFRKVILPLGFILGLLFSVEGFSLGNRFPVVSAQNILWSASNLNDNNLNSSYSSNSFPSSSNPAGANQAWVAAWTGSQVTMNQIFLWARMYNNVAMAFPQQYEVYVTNPENSAWTDLGSFNAQPDPVHGLAVVNLPGTYQTYGVWIVPSILGVDGYGVHYFQLAEIDWNYQSSPGNLSQIDSYVDQVNAGHMNPPPQSDYSNSLTCNIPVWSAPPPTNVMSAAGTYSKVNIGFDSTLGAVGVSFQLINPAYPNDPINIIESRSAGGAGMQIGVAAWDANSNHYGFDQFDGNAFAQQDGFNAQLQASSSGSAQWLSSTWMPLTNSSYNGSPRSPCPGENNSVNFDNGAMNDSLMTVPTQVGNLVSFREQISQYHTVHQYWSTYQKADVLYMNKQIGQQANLREYVGSTTQGWYTGAIYPWNDSVFHGENIYDQNGFLRGQVQLADQVTQWWGVNFNPAYGANYVVFVWNIFGEDIAVVKYGSFFFPALHSADYVYCTKPGDITCGSLDAMWIDTNESDFNYTAGTMDSNEAKYLVGSPAQIQALGFKMGN